MYYVKGRIPNWALIVCGLLVAGLRRTIAKHPCDIGPLDRLLVVLNLLLWVPVVVMCVYLVVNGYRIWRCRTTVPEGKKPWFGTRLVEGAAAARWGLGNMFFGVMAVVFWFYLGYVLLNEVVPRVFGTPDSVIQNCQAPQPHQKTVPTQGNSR